MTNKINENMATMMYRLWYKKDVSEYLNEQTKIDVAKRISELTLKSAIWLDKEVNYIEQFPELREYSNSERISGLQLCIIMSEIVKEIQEKDINSEDKEDNVEEE